MSKAFVLFSKVRKYFVSSQMNLARHRFTFWMWYVRAKERPKRLVPFGLHHMQSPSRGVHMYKISSLYWVFLWQERRISRTLEVRFCLVIKVFLHVLSATLMFDVRLKIRCAIPLFVVHYAFTEIFALSGIQYATNWQGHQLCIVWGVALMPLANTQRNNSTCSKGWMNYWITEFTDTFDEQDKTYISGIVVFKSVVSVVWSMGRLLLRVIISRLCHTWKQTKNNVLMLFCPNVLPVYRGDLFI